MAASTSTYEMPWEIQRQNVIKSGAIAAGGPPDAVTRDELETLLLRGVAAARAAGFVCVAVPNRFTRASDLSAADLRADNVSGADPRGAKYRIETIW